MSQSITRVLIVFGLLPVLAGCASWTTYPPIPGAAQMGRPDYEPGPTIMAEAIRYTYERHAKPAIGEEEIVFNLPEGIPGEVYERVIRRLGPNVHARPMTVEDTRAIHISSVRVRALDSQVDVVYPRRDGMHEMIMLTMRQNMLNQHRVTGSRLWRIHVTAPPPHYVPPAPKDSRPEETATALGRPGEEAPEVDDVEAEVEVQAGAMTDDVND